jgi:hypothetical protein
MKTKTIIRSDNTMRDVWYTLLQVVKPLKATVCDLEYFQINGKDKTQTFPAGSYVIECQTNKAFAKKNYKEITKEQAEKLITIAENDIEKAIETMRNISHN